ncbi:MAG: Flp family type IVb pilin [Negativicutes bacterium]|nr:Flp family type IVb pilin [Negativicutes bacterium]
MLKKVLSQKHGQGMVEYGLIVATIAVAAVVAFQAMGSGLVGVLESITAAL